MFDDELDVFYSPADFALDCTRSRPGESDVQFTGILAAVDAAQFEGQLSVGQYTLQYPTAAADLLAQDVVRTVRTTEAGTVLPAEVWRVMRSPDRMVDGAESVVFLKPDPEA